MTTIIPALLFGLIGLSLLVYTVAVLLKALPLKNLKFPALSIRGISEKAKIKKSIQELQAAETLVKARHTPKSLSEVRRLFTSSLCLDSLFYSEETVSKIVEQQESIMEKIVALSEQYSTHLELLPVLEDLLLGRADLLRENLEISRSRGELVKKQKEKGRTVPEWARSEYEKRLVDLEERVATNRKSIESTLHDLLISLFAENRGKEGDVTYH